MSFVSFAQNFEDVVLWRALHQVEGGRYIDVGAQDPEIDSVSLAFYNAGWRGIHVEPTPTYAARLRDARPDETVIEAVVSNEPGPISFYEIAETGLSTGCEELAKKHKGDGYAHRKITVPCIRLDALFELAGDEVHWLKIDVEGMEADVLRSWGDSLARPWVLTIEATIPNTQVSTTQLWIEEVVRRDYEPVFFDGLSRYFLHKSHQDLARRFEAPANVFDAFVVAPHHFTATEMRLELNSTRQRLDFEWARAEQNAAEHGAVRMALETAQQERETTLEQLANAEREHRKAAEAFALEKNRSYQDWREREQSLRQEAVAAQLAAASVAAELARFQERSDQLQRGLDAAERTNRDIVVRAEESERVIRVELEAARHRLDGARSEFSSTAARLKGERDELWAELQRQRAQAEWETREHNLAIESLRQGLSRADTLITRAAAQYPGRWQQLGEALGLVRRSELHHLLAGWCRQLDHSHDSSGVAEPDCAAGGATKQSAEPALGGRNPYLRANSLSELCSWEGVDFVRCAYVTILGRQPDPDGEAHYLDRLRRGHSKLEVLRDLRRSPEGPSHDPGISGLDRALKRVRWRRYPLLRRFVGPAIDPPVHVSAESCPQTGNADRITDQLDTLTERVEQIQRSLQFIEGSFVKVSDQAATLAPLDRDSFMRRLAITARDFETVLR